MPICDPNLHITWYCATISGEIEVGCIYDPTIKFERRCYFSTSSSCVTYCYGTIADINAISVGDHVVLTYTNCGTCKHCSNHDTSFCKDWERDNFGVGRSDGSKSYSSKEGEAITSHFFGQSSFAKHAVVSQNSLVKVDKNMPLKILAPLGCGIMTGAGGIQAPEKVPHHSRANKASTTERRCAKSDLDSPRRRRRCRRARRDNGDQASPLATQDDNRS